jgi:hypothetical protein
MAPGPLSGRQEISAAALQIFYNSNTFSVVMTGTRHVADGQASREYQSALAFLQSTPHDALEHIHSLRIVFSDFSYDDLCPGSRSLTNWIQTLAYIRENLVLAQLNLTLCTLDAPKDDGYVSGWRRSSGGFISELSGDDHTPRPSKSVHYLSTNLGPWP